MGHKSINLLTMRQINDDDLLVVDRTFDLYTRPIFSYEDLNNDMVGDQLPSLEQNDFCLIIENFDHSDVLSMGPPVKVLTKYGTCYVNEYTIRRNCKPL